MKNRLSKRERVLLGLLAILALAVLCFQYLIQPALSRHRELRVLATKLEADVANLRLWQGKSLELRQEIAALRTELEAAREALTPIEAPQLLRIIERHAKASGTNLRSLALEEPTFKHPSAINIIVSGQYDSVYGFLLGLESSASVALVELRLGRHGSIIEAFIGARAVLASASPEVRNTEKTQRSPFTALP